MASRCDACRPGRGWEIALAVIAGAGGRRSGRVLPRQPIGGDRANSAAEDHPRGRTRSPRSAGFNPQAASSRCTARPATASPNCIPLAPGADSSEGDPIAELASRKDRCRKCRSPRRNLTEAKAARDAAERAGKQKILAAEAELNQAKANKASDLAAIDAKLDLPRTRRRDGRRRRQAAGQAQGKRREGRRRGLREGRTAEAQADAELKATEATRKKTETTYEREREGRAGEDRRGGGRTGRGRGARADRVVRGEADARRATQCSNDHSQAPVAGPCSR